MKWQHCGCAIVSILYSIVILKIHSPVRIIAMKTQSGIFQNRGASAKDNHAKFVRGIEAVWHLA